VLIRGGHDDEDVFDDLHLLDLGTHLGAQTHLSLQPSLTTTHALSRTHASEGMHWRGVKCEGEGPGPRYAAECVTLADDLVLVFGGKNDSKAFNDLHLLRFTSAGTRLTSLRLSCAGPSLRTTSDHGVLFHKRQNESSMDQAQPHGSTTDAAGLRDCYLGQQEVRLSLSLSFLNPCALLTP
jgi:hypothetical protein